MKGLLIAIAGCCLGILIAGSVFENRDTRIVNNQFCQPKCAGVSKAELHINAETKYRYVCYCTVDMKP